MPDFERIDKVEKDVHLLMDLYAKVVIKQEQIIMDCAETFAILASDLQMIRKIMIELETEVNTLNKSAI